jgi:hypothetical protein
MTDIYGRDAESIFGAISTDEISSIDTSTQIDLGSGLIELTSTDLKWNGNEITTTANSVSNPLTTTLEAGGNSINNVDNFGMNGQFVSTNANDDSLALLNISEAGYFRIAKKQGIITETMLDISTQSNIDMYAELDMNNSNIINVGLAGLNLTAINDKNDSITAPIAPRGVSDDWKSVSLSLNPLTTYAEEKDVLLHFGGTSSIYYSLDGGLSETLCTFDIAPTGAMVCGYSSGLFIALYYNTVGGYTSTDGISWVANGQVLFGFSGANIVYFNGLYIASTDVANFRVATSPDGVNWTLRACVRALNKFAVGVDRIVGSGGAYSLDGMTWLDSTNIVVCRGFVYNPDAKLFVGVTIFGTDTNISVDGDTWTTYITPGVTNTQNMLYSSKFKQYYFPTIDSLGNFTLSSSPDLVTTPCRNRLIPNATNQGTLFYSIEYLEPHDRFLFSANVANVMYSINNENLTTYKGLTTSTINGLTTTGGVYMTTTNANLFTGTTETSIFLGSVGVGSLTVPENGFKISSFHLNLSGTFNSINGDTLTVRLKNGSTLGSLVIPLTGTSGEFFECEIDFSIRVLGGLGVAQISTNFDWTNSDVSLTGWRGIRTVQVNSTQFSTLISNTLDVTVQFDTVNAGNSLQLLQAILTKIY